MRAYTQLLKDLGSRLDIPDLEFDEEGCVHIAFDGDLAIMISEDPRFAGLVFSSIVGEAPVGNCEFVENILVSNLFWQNTDGGTLGLESSSRNLVLTKLIDPARLYSVESLEGEIEQFVDRVEFWKQAVVKLAAATKPATGSSPIGVLTA